MNVYLMKLMDRCLGIPLCFLASFFLWQKKVKINPSQIEKILVMKMFGLGSVILVHEMIKAIKEKYPHIKIFFLTFESNKEIAEIYSLCDDVLVIKKDKCMNFIASSLSCLRKIRRQRIDVCIDAEYYSRYTALFSLMSAIPARAGFFAREVYRGRIINFKTNINLYLHMKDNYLSLASNIGLDLKENNLKDKQSFIAGRFRYLPEKFYGLKPGFLIFSPTVSTTTCLIDRKWPFDYFVALGKALCLRGYKIILIGKEDKDYCLKMKNAIGFNTVSFAGNTSIKDLACLMNAAFLVVTNDSGPLHLAAALDVPTFSFFGPGSDFLYAYKSKLHKLFCDRLQCSPCLTVYNYKEGNCQTNSKCLRNILPGKVLEVFEEEEGFLEENFLKRTYDNKKRYKVHSDQRN